MHKSNHLGLNEDTVKTLFLRGIKDESIDILNLIGSDDISQLPLAYF